MGWYKLVFKQNQPIHVGAGKWGVMNETGIFITGQTMWGALVNAYMLKERITENEVKESFEKITNFFPSFDGQKILKPSYEKGEFHLDNFSEEKFRFYFVDTIVQTAVEPLLRRAKDESLHEFDFLLPEPKENIENLNGSLHWIGLIYIEDSDEKLLEFFKDLKIFVGGDVRYGFGEMELEKIESVGNGSDNEELKSWQIVGDKIKIGVDESFRYFIEASLLKEIEVEGELLLIPEFNFKQAIPVIDDARFYFNVGSKIKGISDGTQNVSSNALEYNFRQLKKGKIVQTSSSGEDS